MKSGSMMAVGSKDQDSADMSASSKLVMLYSGDTRTRVRSKEQTVSVQSSCRTASSSSLKESEGAQHNKMQAISGCKKVTEAEQLEKSKRGLSFITNPSTSGFNKRRKGAAPKPINNYQSCLRKARMHIQRIKREELLISAYGSNGWNGSNREKVKPTAELERANRQIDWSKMAVRECLQYCEDAQGDVRNPTNHSTRRGGPRVHRTACSKCGGTDSFEENEILICDGGCGLAYHEQCLDPPGDATLIPEDEDWYCPSCTCKYEILENVNECFEVSCHTLDEVKVLFSSSSLLHPCVTIHPLDSLPTASQKPASSEECDDDGSSEEDENSSGDERKQSISYQSSSPSSSSTSPTSSDADESPMQNLPVTSTPEPSVTETPSTGLNGDRKSRRRRTKIDYRALNDMMFGAGGCTPKVEDDDDEEYVPSNQRTVSKWK